MCGYYACFDHVLVDAHALHTGFWVGKDCLARLMCTVDSFTLTLGRDEDLFY